MYTTYFGLREQPFNITPTSRLFYTNPVYEEAYTKLLNGVRQRRGLMVLTGEVGTGKTTVLSRLMDSLGEDPTVQFVFSYDTILAFEEFLCVMCEGFGLSEREEGAPQTVQVLADFLRRRAQEGKITALLIDEAQELEDGVLQGLLQLPDLQIMLVGQQPELEEKLNQPSLSQLRQRIAFQCQLQHLKPAEVTAFIYHRLRLVGYERQGLFSTEALQLITTYSQGIPRLVNLICDNALRVACGALQHTVSGDVVQKVVHTLRLGRASASSLEGDEDERGEMWEVAAPLAEMNGEIFLELPDGSPRSQSGSLRGVVRSLTWVGGTGILVTLLGLMLLPAGVAELEQIWASLLSFSPSQSAVRGKAVVEGIARAHPEVRPNVWGLATVNPAIALVIPETAWDGLSPGDQVSLTLYLESLIAEARANPDAYLEEFRTASGYKTLREKVARLCRDCWMIGVGHLLFDTEGVLFDRVVVQGDSLWEKASTHNRGGKASEFRAALATTQ